jgi:hypothetical protein
VARYILALPIRKTVSIKDISENTFILPEDVVAALKEMDVVGHKKQRDGTAVVNKAKVREWVSAQRLNMEPVVDPGSFLEPAISCRSSVTSGL